MDGEFPSFKKARRQTNGGERIIFLSPFACPHSFAKNFRLMSTWGEGSRGVKAAATPRTESRLQAAGRPSARRCRKSPATICEENAPPAKAGTPYPGIAVALTLLCLFTPNARSAEPWETALSRMPLPTNVRELNGTNFGPTLLQAFQSNSVAKALILMPGAIDEFYFFRRARAQLPAAATLLDALRALENQTRIRATFRAPCVLLHAPPDPLTASVRSLDQPTFERLCARRFPDTLDYFDRDWPALRPLLARTFTSVWTGYPEVVPASASADSWHFYRASIRAWNLDAREGLEALTLATRTTVTIDQRRLRFECDPRASAPAGR